MVLAQANSAVTEFVAFLRELVAERQNHPGGPDSDVLTRLLRGDTNPCRRRTDGRRPAQPSA